MNILLIVNIVSGVLMTVAGGFFYLYGKEFFFHQPDTSWIVVSLGMVLAGVSEILVGFFSQESYLTVGSSILSSMVLLAGMFIGYQRAKEGEI